MLSKFMVLISVFWLVGTTCGMDPADAREKKAVDNACEAAATLVSLSRPVNQSVVYRPLFVHEKPLWTAEQRQENAGQERSLDRLMLMLTRVVAIEARAGKLERAPGQFDQVKELAALFKAYAELKRSETADQLAAPVAKIAR